MANTQIPTYADLMQVSGSLTRAAKHVLFDKEMRTDADIEAAGILLAHAQVIRPIQIK